MIFIILPIVIFILFFISMGYFLSGPKYKGPVSDHFDGKKFFTPGGRPAQGFKAFLGWITKRERTLWKPQTSTAFGDQPPEREGRGARITFVNHSTFLIQADGINILTDPVWSKRTSPFQFAGPKRLRPPGIRIEDLPKIDVILLSHNHYDHLDLNTMKKLYKDHQPKIICALGVKAFLDVHHLNNATDLDWWQTFSLSESIEIQAVPAQHFSGRGTFDRDATLWCGFVIRRPGGNIYFMGDTGYHETFFKEIGERCGPLDVSLIPIGAYKPEWFMSPIHCSPMEAVKIHQEIKSRKSIATHFGTFQLADDGKTEPVEKLEEALRQNNIPLEDFIALKEGEAREF